MHKKYFEINGKNLLFVTYDSKFLTSPALGFVDSNGKSWLLKVSTNEPRTKVFLRLFTYLPSFMFYSQLNKTHHLDIISEDV